jgi:hypothetical protein
MLSKSLTGFTIVVGICLVAIAIGNHSVYALTSTERYNSGYNHGCSDGKIGSHSYLVGSGGASSHTADFMSGYNVGYTACSLLGSNCVFTNTCTSPKPVPGSWILDVGLTSPPFGVTGVNVHIKGPFGYPDTHRINWQQEVNRQGSVGPIHVKFTIPPNVIPVGYQFQVCVSQAGDVLSVLLPHCQYFPRQSAVTMTVR